MHVNPDAVNFGEPTQDVGGYKVDSLKTHKCVVRLVLEIKLLK